MNVDQKVEIPANTKVSQIVVPTVDTVRYSYLLDLLIRQNRHVLLVGPTGTGKSVYVTNKLLFGLGSEYLPVFVNFSAQTSANQTQEIIMSKLDKRRKGTFGPALGQRAVIFVDDLNMPLKEKYGAQPPIELLRQWMDHGMWYDLKDTSALKLIDIQIAAAMGPPGGGRQHISPRLARHFQIIGVSDFEETTMKRIFSTILDWHFTTKNFATSVAAIKNNLISATFNIYQSAIQNLLPTPRKSHYVFNLRDFSRVIQGLLLAHPDKYQEKDKMIRLWIHEVYRVFYDRLNDDVDRKWLFDSVDKVLYTQFNCKMNDVLSNLAKDGKVTDEDLRSLIFGDYLAPSNAQVKVYDEITDINAAVEALKVKLVEYNGISKAPMNLVMFRFALEHVSRVSRILKQPAGHVLSVGVGGSGRQSLARLASFMAGFQLFQVEISRTYGMIEWREDLKKIVKKAGVEAIPCVFLFSDTQLKLESFLEDLNNLLNTGDVPNLFPADEKNTIVETMRTALKSTTDPTKNSPAALFNAFLERCRDNLHVVLCMSPIGDAFRNRLRMFPSLVNCCTIDWFQSWPNDALEVVASRFLEEADMPSSLRPSIVNMCKLFHQSILSLSEKFYNQLRRHNYVTPTSYLELIQTFKTLLAIKRDEVNKLKSRYDVGLTQLASAAKQVSTMQVELNDLKPKLIETSKETDRIMEVIARDSVEVEKKRSIVKADEEVANQKASVAKGIKEECEADLSEALPALEAALSALDTLKPQGKRDVFLLL